MLKKLFKIEIEKPDHYGLQNLFNEDNENIKVTRKTGFIIDRRETFKNASLKLYINPLSKFDEYNGGYEAFFNEFKPFKKYLIEQALKDYTTFKQNICIHVQFYKKKTHEFVELIYSSDNVEYFGIESFETKYEDFIENVIHFIQEREEGESELIYDDINYIEIGIAKIELLRGGSYIELPFKCNTVLNIKNENTNDCFKLSLIANFFPAPENDKNPNRPIHYYAYETLLDYGIDQCKKYSATELEISKNIYNRVQKK